MLLVARATGAAVRSARPALVVGLRVTSGPLRLALVGATAAASSRAACDDEPPGQSLNEDDSAFLLDAAQTQQALAAHIAQLRRRGPLLGAAVLEAHPAPHWSTSTARTKRIANAPKRAAAAAAAVDNGLEEGETPYTPDLEWVEYTPFDFEGGEDGPRRRRAAARAPAEPAPAAAAPPQTQPQPAAAPPPPQPEPPVAVPSEALENAATARAEKGSASQSSTNPGGRPEFRRCCKGYGGGIGALNATCELLIARGMPEADAIAVRFPASERARSRSSETRALPPRSSAWRTRRTRSRRRRWSRPSRS